MIRIRITDTGFVSGDAWETIGYEGDINSRIIHTTYHEISLTDQQRAEADNIIAGYCISSKVQGRVVNVLLNENNDITIPKELMAISQKLWFQFYLKSQLNNEIIFHSNPFCLNIASSINDVEVILEPGANEIIVVNTIEDRDSIPRSQLADGKIVKVVDVATDTCSLYTWDNTNLQWIDGAIKIADIFGLREIINNLTERIIALEEKNQ